MSDSEPKGCPITGCPPKQVLIATIAAFAVIFGFDFVYHSIYMMPDYEATASLWRDEAAMQEYFHFALIGQFLKAFAAAGIFCWICKGCGNCSIKTGLKIGMFIGLLSASMSIASHAWMPTPLDLNIKWAAGDLLQGLLIGLVLSLICSKCKSSCNKEG